MTIQKKSREELQKQVKGFVYYAGKNGIIDKDKSNEIYEALGGKDVDLSEKEMVRQQLLGVLNPKEFEELYEKFYELYSTKSKDLRKQLENLKLFPDKYNFLTKNFFNTEKKNRSVFSLLEDIQETSDAEFNEIRKLIQSNIIFFENLSFDKNDIGRLDFDIIFDEYVDDMKKIIKQLEIQGINGVDNFNKLVRIITSSNADRVIKNMEILRNEFGIEGVENLYKLTDLIKYGDPDNIERNMKFLRDEFGIEGVENFSKLTDLIKCLDPDNIEKIMKMLRDEFGIGGVENFSKLTDLIKYGDSDKIERNMKILRDEFGINGAEDFSKFNDLIMYGYRNNIERNMKILRDEFGINGAENFSKLMKIIKGYSGDNIERNMKMLRDEFGIREVDDFSKLAGIIGSYSPSKIEKNMKMLRDEFGIHEVDDFSKLAGIIDSYSPDNVEKIMKMLRDEFGIEGVENFSKLEYLIGYYSDPINIERNMKLLRDEFGIEGVEKFSKLTDLIKYGDPDKIKRNMKMLRDEFGIEGVENLYKLTDLIKNGDPDNIERNVKIFKYEFGIEGVDNFFKWEYFIKCLKLPITSNFKEENHKGYLKFLNEIVDTNYDPDKKCKMIEKVVTLTFEQAQNYAEVFNMLDDSISMDIQRVKNELIDELLETDNPNDIAQQIINIFERNNLPLTGKIFKVFELLYPKEKFKATLQSHGSPVLHKYLDEGKKVYDLIYRDLMNIAIKSGDRSLRDYLNTFVGSEELLKKFEDIVVSEGFDGNNVLCLDKKLEEDEQARLLYLFRRISVLYNRYYGKEINEGNTIEDKKYGESTVADNQLVEFYNDIKKGFHLRRGESIYDRLQRFLSGLGYHSFSEVLGDMEKSKKEAHERGLKLYNEAVDNGGKIKFPNGAFLKGVGNDAFSKIINRGVTCREYLGGGDDGKAARSDCTPFDIDGLYLDSPVDWKGYGDVLLITDVNRCDIVDTREKGISGYKENQYELFKTGAIHQNHYGIRTGMPMTEIDYIIYQGSFRSNEFQDICYEIARNGYYIPITDKEGNVKFTPEMYHNIRKGFDYMQYYDGFDTELVDGKGVSKETDNVVNKEYTGTNDKITNDRLKTLITDNSPSNEKYSGFAKENRELAENTIEWIKVILENQCGIKFNSKHDTSITGAELHDSGSTGRGTDIPTKDVDLDFTLILDANDYNEKLELIIETIYRETGTLDKEGEGKRTGGFQMKSKKNKIGQGPERPDGISLDLLILKKSQVIDYSSSDAMKEKLDYINDNLGEEDLDRVRTNVIIMKKLLKSQNCYKKTSTEGGIAGIGVENWITQHHGSFIEALESFEKVAYGGEYEPGKQPVSLEIFKEKYPIYDAGENYKDGCNDNFVDKINEHGYNGMLNIVIALRTKGIEGIEELILEYEEKKGKYIG